MAKFTYTEEFEHRNCPQCGVNFYVPEMLMNDKRSHKGSFWCPNGHERVFRESDADRMRRERDIAQQQLARAESERLSAERERDAANKKLKKLTVRAQHGAACPHCNRVFVNVARHVATKHGTQLKCVA